MDLVFPYYAMTSCHLARGLKRRGVPHVRPTKNACLVFSCYALNEGVTVVQGSSCFHNVLWDFFFVKPIHNQITLSPLLVVTIFAK